MFKYKSFKTTRKYFPINGLNLDVNKRYIDDKYCSDINNIIPFPMGCGTVRNGSILEFDAYATDPIYKYVEFQGFYVSREQFLCYVSDFVKDTISSASFVFAGDTLDYISFRSNNLAKYTKGTYILLKYFATDSGDVEIRLKIKSVAIVSGNCRLKVEGFNDINLYGSTEKTIKDIFFSDGKIWKIDRANKNVTVLKEGLVPQCSPNFCLFKDHLFIANGVDNVLMYDGIDLIDAYTWKLETLEDIRKTGNRKIAFTSRTAIQENYLNQTIKTSTQTLRCVAFTKNENDVELEFNSDVANFQNARNSISYKQILPKFSYLAVVSDRLFALGPGLSSIYGRDANERLAVYYQFAADTLDLWTGNVKKFIPRIDLSIKHGNVDNIEAIASISGYVLFIGREKTQVWSAGEPENIDNPNLNATMVHVATLNIGCIHKDMVSVLPNMVIVASQNGMHALSSLNPAKQFAATPLVGVNNYFKWFSSEVTQNQERWLSTRSFSYSKGGFYGLRLSNNPCIIGFLDRPSDLFSKFTGDFQNASCFATSDENLFYCIGNKIFSYGDGYGQRSSFGDMGKTKNIEFSAIFSPVKQTRYLNYYIDIDIDNPSNFERLTVIINGENGKYFEKVLSDYKMDDRGDFFDSLPLYLEELNNRDDAFQMSLGKYRMPQNFRFNSNEFYIKILGNTKSGKIIINKLELYGK